MATGRQLGGIARAASMTPEQRKEMAQKGVRTRMERKAMMEATHGSADRPLCIGDEEIPCYVLSDGTRVLTMRGLQSALGFSGGGGKEGARKIPSFLLRMEKKGINIKDLALRADSPIDFKISGGVVATGYEATILADICDAIMEARKVGALPADSVYAAQAELLLRGLARVGIIALVDEATGYQKDRAKDALAKILEEFVAKELQPWVKTFPTAYYENLFRIYGLQFPPEGKPQWSPQFFGKITNDVVYQRLAPELLPELKKAASKAEKKAKLHQWLSSDTGHPKLREHLASLVTLLRLSKTPQDFKRLVDTLYPRYGSTVPFDFDIEN